MGDLGDDTAVVAQGDGRFRGSVSAEWNLWGPVGGYLASIALRAAGAHTTMARPASFACHYLSPARFEDAELVVTSLRRSYRAESLRVLMTQRGTPVLDALVWAVADGLDGPQRNWVPAFATVPPSSVEPLVLDGEGFGAITAAATYWNNVEIRKVPCEPGEPMLRSWERFLPTPSFGDPWIDACRELISADVAVFPTVATALPARPFIAPNLDLYVAFHTVAPVDEFFLVEARGSAAGAGLLGGQVRIWSRGGTLAATANSQLLCRML